MNSAAQTERPSLRRLAVLAVALGCGLAAATGHAQTPPEEEEPEATVTPPEPIDVSVFGDRRNPERVAGSAHRVGEEALERREDDNAHRILARIPGVYVRGEDGFGLRPNIGLRGGNSDRSSKVTLMEDGVLFGPAPYSAPAAYFFPLMTRMVGVEVFKGPAAIQHGPNTIGGAINFLSRRIPYGHALGADVGLGTNRYAKGHGHYGYGTDHWGVLVEGVRLRSDGFKVRDDGGPTGFDKMEFMAKARVNTDPAAPVYHEGRLKLGYAREVSDETYLGLSEDDFAATPVRRYLASGLGEMSWNRIAFHVGHAMVVRDLVEVSTTAYRHDFDRTWRRLARFTGGPPLFSILLDPTGARAPFHDVLRGAADSRAPGESLGVTDNARVFVSQGVQSTSRWDVPDLGPVGQRVHVGVRVHQDSAERNHTEDVFRVRDGALRATGAPTATVTDNRGSAIAVAAHVRDEIDVGRFLIVPGVRLEYVRTNFADDLADDGIEGSVEGADDQFVVLPGVAVLYQATDRWGFLAGVHRGYSPVTPGQADDVRPEVSVNVEGGARVTHEVVQAEAIGFLSDYSNLSGECTFSSGCSETFLNQQFNGGRALIYGLETSVRAEVPTSVGLRFPLSAAYTLTQTELRTPFTSNNPQLAQVEVGDELPYVPRHQLAATAGVLIGDDAGLEASVTWIDRMREAAGQGGPLPASEVSLDDFGRLFTDHVVNVDLAGHVRVLPEMKLYGRVENLLDRRSILSRRPFGARPTRPLFVQAGVEVAIR
ncbi:MAG: TonB-dependent receptor [Myxococcota bacterium]